MTWLFVGAVAAVVLMVVPIDWLLAVVGLAGSIANRRGRD